MPEVTYSENSFELHEPDEWYPGVIASVEDGDDYGYGPTVKFIIHIDGETDMVTDEPRETWAMCSAKLSKRSKLYGWVSAIDSSLIPVDGGTLNLNVLEGRAVDVMFEHAESENGTRDRVVKMRSRKDTKTKATTTEKPKVAVAASPTPSDDPF